MQNPEHLAAAKRLHASVYLRRGFVQPSDVHGGQITLRADPHQAHASYFVAMDTHTHTVIATVRQIHARRKHGHYSFPMFASTNLYKRTRRLISTHAPYDCVEISGLAKHQAADSIVPLLLYRAMWHQSIRERHQLWLMACDTRLFDRLQALFGPAIKRAGRVTAYPGGNVVPAILDVQSSVQALRQSLSGRRSLKRAVRRRVVAFFIRGLPVEYLMPKEQKAYEELKRYE